MRRRLIMMSVFAVLMLSFIAVGCSEETCKDLKAKLEQLQNDIIKTGNERRELDQAGEPGTANKAAQLKELEEGLRSRFAATAAEYLAKGCEDKTGEVPSLPPMMPVTETAFD